LSSRAASFDVVIVGGGPAGSAAAIAARRRNLRVLIVERGPTPPPGGCPGWLGPAAVKLCRECGVDGPAGGVEFSGLRLRSWDLKRCAAVQDGELRGWIVDPAGLSAALLKAAAAGGADVRRGVRAEQLELGEATVTLRLSDGKTVAGQVVLIADGAGSVTARSVQLAGGTQSGRSGACAQAVLQTAAAAPANAELDVVVGAGGGLKLATLVRRGSCLRITLLTYDESAPAAAQLAALLQTAKAAGIIPAAASAPPVAVPCLAGLALEMETHVSKRCLLIGDAGGFVSAFSNEGIYPALRSGWLAAETVARALQAPLLQDELASFSSDWRANLADYLRMPNTDLGLLLPMVFNNPQMSRRVARAFLLGQAF
jgi:flavin-dependent dehydrogenase